MVEPGTIGTLVSRVLGMASEAARQDIASEAAKDAYNALTRKLSCRAASDVDALERNPTSAARRAVIAEAVDQLPEVEKISVKTLATELADTLKPGAAQGRIGIDVRRMDVERDVREIKTRKAESLAV